LSLAPLTPKFICWCFFDLPYTCAFYQCVFACGISNLYIDTSARIFALYSDTAVTYVTVAGDFVAKLGCDLFVEFSENCGSFLLLYVNRVMCVLIFVNKW